MSRNLGRTDCYFCSGKIRLEEQGRPITREEAGPYFELRNGYSYEGMIVARAICEDCEAKYLAWIDQSRCCGYGLRQRHYIDG